MIPAQCPCVLGLDTSGQGYVLLPVTPQLTRPRAWLQLTASARGFLTVLARTWKGRACGPDRRIRASTRSALRGGWASLTRAD